MDKKILIVSRDYRLIRNLYQGLKEENVITYSAESVKEGLIYYTQNSFNLIILDIDVSKKDSECLVRNFSKLRSIPVLVLSSSLTDAQKQELLRIGATVYLNKSSTIKEIIAYIQSLMRISEEIRGKDKKEDSLISGKRFTIDTVNHKVIFDNHPILS